MILSTASWLCLYRLGKAELAEALGAKMSLYLQVDREHAIEKLQHWLKYDRIPGIQLRWS